MSEWAFLQWLKDTDRPGVRIPIGDDAAGLDLPPRGPLLWALDTIVAGVHFEWPSDPRAIGRKALAVNLSDLAAMGARPLGALLGLTLPSPADPQLGQALVQAIRATGAAFGCPLLGGDTVAAAGPLALCVTVLGVPMGEEPIQRSGAKAGDAIVLTGAIGGSIHGRHLHFEPRLAEAETLVGSGALHAMIDVSDGLLVDLHRLADASQLGFALYDRDLPIHEDARGESLDQALKDGEDFELLGAVATEGLDDLLRTWPHRTPLRVIGRFLPPECGRLRHGLLGDLRLAERSGYEHR